MNANVGRTNASIKLKQVDENSRMLGATTTSASFSLPSSTILVEDKNDVNQVKPYAYAICREYLAGAWKHVDICDVKVERISGGLSNYLYMCEINANKFKQCENEPRRILLRLYGEHHSKNQASLLKDVAISVIMSDHRLGPKLYGLFSSGRLEEFITHPTMDQNDMYIPEYSREIARVTAKYHMLEMPFIKEPHWLFDTTNKYLKQINDVKFSNDKDLKRFDKFLSYNMDVEFRQLKSVLKSINSPVVFCHNDINIGNILKLPNKLMMIDYEYGSYNYRGFDFGNHFCEWMFNNNYDKYPYFQYNYDFYPNREQQLNFLNAYVEHYKEMMREQQKLKVDNETDENKIDVDPSDQDDQGTNATDKENIKHLNSTHASKNLNIEHLIIEANYFALVSHIFWANWSVCQAAVCKIKFEYLDYALARCDAYFRQKRILFPEGFNSVKV